MSDRMRRVNEAVRQVLSEAVGELKDPRIGFVTVTGVETSPYLRDARVFVSVLGSEKQQQHSLTGLEAAHGVLQGRLDRELRLKRTPQHAFEYDPTVERGVRMTQLIDELGPHDGAPLVLDIDHHHDNTRFGQINLIVPNASSTGEVLRDVFAELGVDMTPEIAEALYIALVTDTGRFQYSNTTAKALRLAAELVDAGADVHRIFRGVYETVQFAKLKLLARALERATIYDGGRVVVSYLLRSDFTDI